MRSLLKGKAIAGLVMGAVAAMILSMANGVAARSIASQDNNSQVQTKEKNDSQHSEKKHDKSEKSDKGERGGKGGGRFGGDGWMNSLNLTPEQKTAIDAIVARYHNEDYKAKMKRLRELRQQQGENTTANAELENLRKEINIINENMGKEIVPLLTPEQAEKFKEMMSRRGRGRGRG
jgi:Spy/CpxP family protein refolding chaperone